VLTDKVQSANYNVVLNTTPGQNAVYQTNVLQNLNSATTANVTSGNELVNKINPIDAPATNPITGEKLNYNFQVRNDYVNKNDQDTVIMGASNTENSLNKIDNRLRDVDVNRSGYLTVEFQQGYPDSPKEGQVVDNYVKLTWYDANGDGSESVYAPAEFDNSGKFLGLIDNNWAHNLFPPVTGLIFPSDDFNVDMTALSAFNEGTLDLAGINDVMAGDKVLLGISDRNSAADAEGAPGENMYVRLNSFSNDSDEVYVDVQFNQLSNTTQTFQQVEMDENGNVWTYKYGVDFASDVKGKVDDMSRVEEGPYIPVLGWGTGINNILGYHDKATVSFDVTETKESMPVTENTKLKDIKQFVTSDGQKTFANSQDLTIYGGNGKQAKIHLTGNDTVKDLESKVNNAVAELGLASNDPTINDKLITFVTPENKSMFDGNVVSEGSLVVQSAVPGKDGRLFFTGNEKLLQGLSVSQLREADEGVRTAEVYDLYNGTLIGKEIIKDNKMVSTINGAEVYFNSASNKYAQGSPGWENGGITYQPYTEKIDLHLIDNQQFVHAGANAEQKIEFIIPQIDTTALGVNGVSVVTAEAAEESLYAIDNAQNILNNARGIVGAQMNRMEYRLNQINVMSENSSAAESRIRDLDMAKEMTNFTKNQILSQTASAMLAQANMMPQLVLQLLGA
jgi:flagellin